MARLLCYDDKLLHGASDLLCSHISVGIPLNLSEFLSILVLYVKDLVQFKIPEDGLTQDRQKLNLNNKF